MEEDKEEVRLEYYVHIIGNVSKLLVVHNDCSLSVSEFVL